MTSKLRTVFFLVFCLGFGLAVFAAQEKKTNTAALLSGTVMDHQGSPLAGVQLFLVDGDGEVISAQSDDRGKIALKVKTMPDSLHLLLASPGGLVLLETDATFGQGLTWVFPEPVEQTVRLDRPAPEQVILQLFPQPPKRPDERSSVENDALLKLLKKAPQAIVFSQGKLEATLKVTPQTQLLVLYSPPFDMTVKQVEPGTPWEMKLTAGEKQSLRLTDPAGRELAGVEMRWQRARGRGRGGSAREGRQVQQAEGWATALGAPASDDQGNLAFGGVKDWTAGSLVVFKKGYSDQTVALNPGQRNDVLPIQMEPETVITGTLKRAPGIDLQDSLTMVLVGLDKNGRPNFRSQRKTMVVQAEQAFHWSGLAAGKYWLMVFEGAPFRPRKELQLQTGQTFDLGDWLMMPDQALLLKTTDLGGQTLDQVRIQTFANRFWEYQKGRAFELPDMAPEEAEDGSVRTNNSGQGGRNRGGGNRWRRTPVQKSNAEGITLMPDLGEDPTRFLVFAEGYQATLLGPLEGPDLKGRRDVPLASATWFSGLLTNRLDLETIQDAVLELVPMGEDDSGLSLTTSLREDGSFLVGGVPAGPAMFRLSVPGYSTLEKELIVSPGIETRDLGELRVVRVLDPLVVFFDGISGDPIPGVVAEESRGFRGVGDKSWGPSDEDGELTLSMAPEGEVRLKFSAENYAQQEVRWLLPFPEKETKRKVHLTPGGSLRVRVDGLTEPMDGFVTIEPQGGETIRQRMTFHPDQTPDEVFHLVAGPVSVSLTEFSGGKTLKADPLDILAGEEVTAVISGIQDDEKLASFQLLVTGLDLDGALNWSVSFSAESGWFTLEDGLGEAPESLLEPGSKAISVRGYAGRMPYNSDIQIETSATVSGQGPAQVQLPVCAITGRLDLPPDSEPGSISLVARGNGLESRSRMDAQAGFTLAGLTPGRYTLSWIRGSTGGLVLPDLDGVDVSSNEIVDLGSIAVAQAGTVFLSVRSDGGEPLGEVRVTAMLGSSMMQLGRTDVGGKLTLHLDDPSMDLLLSRTGYARTPLTINAQDPELNVVLAEEALLQVRVVDADGQPLVNAGITVVVDQNSRSANTDDSGMALINQLPAGPAVISATPHGSIPMATQELELVPGQFYSITFGSE